MNERHGALTSEGERLPSPPRELEYVRVDPPPPGGATQISDGLLWVRIPLPMEPAHINVWLMNDGAAWTLVDTGMALEPCREAWSKLEQHTLGGRAIGRIVVTHDHPDHMALSPWLQRRHGAEVWMSAVAHESAAEFLAAEPETIYARMRAFMVEHGAPSEGWPAKPPVRHDNWFDGVPVLSFAPPDGHEFQVADRDWRVVETSGHCRGHLCLYDAAGRLLISGDQVLPAISPNVSVLSSRPEADPLREFLASLAKLERCAEDTLVLPSHGRPFRGLHHRISNLRAHHAQQLGALHAACFEPRTAFELLPTMFGRELRGFHRVLAMGEAVAHLNYLLSEGRVERYHDEQGVVRFVARTPTQ